MLKQEDREKIERYIAGHVNESEKEWVEALFLNGEDNTTLRNSMEKDWIRMAFDESSSDVNLSHLLDRVHHIIRKNETLKRKQPVQRFIRIYMKTAAILFLPLLVAGGLVHS
jgi:hypothetical protein